MIFGSHRKKSPNFVSKFTDIYTYYTKIMKIKILQTKIKAIYSIP